MVTSILFKCLQTELFLELPERRCFFKQYRNCSYKSYIKVGLFGGATHHPQPPVSSTEGGWWVCVCVILFFKLFRNKHVASQRRLNKNLVYVDNINSFFGCYFNIKTTD